jgi:hypothetical protein
MVREGQHKERHMGAQRVRIRAGEVVFPEGTFPDLEQAKHAVHSALLAEVEEYGGDVPVLFLDAAYDPDPEPTLPDEPDPRDQVGSVEP